MSSRSMTRRPRKHQVQNWQSRHYFNEISDNADQTEWQAFLYGQAHISVGTRDEEISESADQDTFPNARSEDVLQGKEVIMESVQGTVAEILLERKALLGDAYPFSMECNSLIYQARPLPIYELLLGITQAPTITEGAYTTLPRIFEDISLLASKGYLGPQAKGYRTGWPRPDTNVRFKAMIENLRTTTGKHGAEWQWSPDSDLPDDPAPAFVKEEGLDLVAWREWGDGRAGQLYLFGQCACGNNWLGKDSDLKLEILNRWFKLPRVIPVRSFFTPRYVVRDLLNELSLTAGLFFDRIRIVHALNAEHLAPELGQLAPLIINALSIAKGEATSGTTTAPAKKRVKAKAIQPTAQTSVPDVG